MREITRAGLRAGLVVATLLPGIARAAGFGLTAGGTAAYDTAGAKFTGALNGGYAYDPLNYGPLPTAGSWTAEAWVKSAKTAAIQVAYGQNNVFWVGCDSNGYANAGYGYTPKITSTATLCDGTYHHTAFVSTAGGVALYVDGVSVGTAAALTAGNSSTINYRFMVREYDGNLGQFTWGGSVDELAVWSAARYTANFTPPAAAYAGTEANLVALFHLDGALADSQVPTGTTVAANNAALTYSPGNWNVTAAGAETINPGAYMTFIYTGATPPTLTFAVSGQATPLPQIGIQIDDQAVVRSTLAASVTPTPPSNTAAWPRHVLRLSFLSSADTNPAWSARTASVVLSSLLVPGGSTLYATTPAPLTGIAFGDSITQGLDTLGSGTLVNVSDASLTTPWLLRRLLGAEIGVVGFGGQWISPSAPVTAGAVAGQNGDAGVPPLSNAYGLLWAGQARSFPANLDFVLVNSGTNDFVKGGNCAGVTEGFRTLLSGLLASVPARTRLFVQQPYDVAAQYPAFDACIQAGIAASSNPSRVTYLPTAGWMDLAQTADGIHPLGILNIRFAGLVASQVAAALGVKLPAYTY